MEEVNFFLDEAKESMEKAVKHTEAEFTKIRAGRVMPNMLDGLMVNYYGSPTPIGQVANVSTPDARTLMIKPWEKNLIGEIEKAIKNSDLGVQPNNDGEAVRLNFPPMSEERRKQLVKNASQEAEHGKVSIRSVRKETNEALKKLQKDGVPEDEIKKAEEKVQGLTKKFEEKIDELLKKKEHDILTV
ncbi:MAG: ribosome recycling factor [Bernardetiaceae bacterium]|nr:ribosome recycling factor [Bernardetiaceae bacterium]